MKNPYATIKHTVSFHEIQVRYDYPIHMIFLSYESNKPRSVSFPLCLLRDTVSVLDISNGLRASLLSRELRHGPHGVQN
jgi:hypothetical protein